MSNIIVFGEIKNKPVNLYEFCFSAALQIQEVPISRFDKPTCEAINKYFEGIKFFLKLDPLYYSQLF